MPTILEKPRADVTGAARISYEQFLDWLDEDTLAEWVDGEVHFRNPPSAQHQTLQGFLGTLLRSYGEEKQLGIVISAPFQMRLETRPSGREPDLLFISSANQANLRETFLDGPADLVVEIISPESRARDRGDKFYEYETGGVAEYWLLDPSRQRAEWYQRGDDGIYESVVAQDGVYHSREIAGLWLREAWLWQPPRVLEVLREWQLI